MKVLRSEEIRAVDQYTITHEPISSIDLMERASLACVQWLLKHSTVKRYFLFCGSGNNGGDGLAIARLLSRAGKDVQTFLITGSAQASPDNQSNQARLKEAGKELQLLTSIHEIPAITENDIVIDALFGTGLTRALSGFVKELVATLNTLPSQRIAIDLPSGLPCDAELAPGEVCFHAHHTLSFQVPKLCFFLPSCGSALGEWTLLDIGLDQTFISNQKSTIFYLETQDAAQLVHARSPFSHKGTFGHALIIAGSFGKMGAAVLATRAALRSGSGLVSCYVPSCGHEILQVTAPEAMVLSAENKLCIDHAPDTSRFTSIALGPGIGQDALTESAVLDILRNSSQPIVMDADALNILSTLKDWPSLLPKDCILTPHPKEFDRLFGSHSTTLERIQTHVQFAKTQKCCLILKGRYTSIALPNGDLYFNSSGNPGMATGGSGDVLSGILAGLLAQGYSLEDSCLLGVHLHGLAGDLSKVDQGEEALIASDLIEHLGAAFLRLKETDQL